MATLPNTVSQLSHGMTIQVTGASGSVTVGAINEWNPRASRAVTELYAFGTVDGGYSALSAEPFENAPGNISGQQLDVRRWDQYGSQMEVAFGTTDVTMLTAQLDAFTVQEVWRSPGETNNFSRLYRGCWWMEVSRAVDAKGDRTINVGGTIRYTRRERAA